MKHLPEHNNSKITKGKNYLFIYIISFIILILTIVNLNNYINPINTKVLGVEASNTDGIFWYNLLRENPDYIPGWIEIGRTDKIKLIDPNYF